MESDFLKVITAGTCDGDFRIYRECRRVKWRECGWQERWNPNIDYPDEELTVYNDGGTRSIERLFLLCMGRAIDSFSTPRKV